MSPSTLPVVLTYLLELPLDIGVANGVTLEAYERQELVEAPILTGSNPTPDDPPTLPSPCGT